tara:strand:+ start:1771 stop:2286 length:516 start_codon:yes stop_codon:yes gene_type:complete
VVGAVRDRRHHHRAIAEQPVRPDELQERVHHEEHRHQQAQFPPRAGGGRQLQPAGDAAQPLAVADQRQQTARGDHAGAGKERRPLAQAGQDVAVEDARVALDEMAHPFPAIARHQHRDRRPPRRRAFGEPADPQPGDEQERQRGHVAQGHRSGGNLVQQVHDATLGPDVAP